MGISKGFPYKFFLSSLQNCVCWDLIRTKREVIKFYSNLHENFTMLPNYTESRNPRTNNERIMVLSKCAVCDSKKLKYIKEQEASEFLSSLGIGIKTPLIKLF